MGRTSIFSYENASSVPAAATAPTGETVSYEYLKELGNVVKNQRARKFSKYETTNTLTGAITSATQASGTIRQMTYYPSGLLKNETSMPAMAPAQKSYRLHLLHWPAVHSLLYRGVWCDATLRLRRTQPLHCHRR